MRCNFRLKNQDFLNKKMSVCRGILDNSLRIFLIINKKNNWISVGASIRINEIDLFNKQLDNLNCQTLKDLCNLLIAGKLRRITDEEQVDIMKVQTQATGLSTAQTGHKFDFWKQVDDE